jgi:TRAP-type C4-dicarboxylate transport system permease small subunit
LRQWIRYSGNAINTTSLTMSVIATTIVMLMMVLVTADVLMRYFFSLPIRGSNELIESMMLIVVFLGLAYAQYNKENISISLLVDKLPQKAQAVIDSFAYVICLGVTILIAWAAIVRMGNLLDTGTYTPVLEIPIAILQCVLTFGCIMLCIVFLWDILHSFFNGVER